MPTTTGLKICLASSEITPLAKTGGLADVSAALPSYLHREGHDVRVLMPRYAGLDTTGFVIEPVAKLARVPIRIGDTETHFAVDVARRGDDVPIYLLRYPAFYERATLYTNDADEHRRFILLSRAAIVLCQYLEFAPDIFHCHDWHTALIPLYLKTIYAWDRLFAHTRSVLTIHNIGYQGVFGAKALPDLDLHDAAHMLHQDDLAHGHINFLKTGVLHAHLLTTVSPTYAREIQGPEYGMGLEHLLAARRASLVGILNGVDYAEWDPAVDPLIRRRYSDRDLRGKAVCKAALMEEMALEAGPARPLFGIVSRLVSQKGVDLLEQALPPLLERHDIALAVLGSGEARYETLFERLAGRFPGRVAFHRGYSNGLAHRIEAGSDLFLMPSLYEPCGLNQMYSLKYGTVPIVRATGGLADSVEAVDPRAGTGTGFLFRDYSAAALTAAIESALEQYADGPHWRAVMRNGMRRDFSWEKQGAEYVRLFRELRDSARAVEATEAGAEEVGAQEAEESGAEEVGAASRRE